MVFNIYHVNIDLCKSVKNWKKETYIDMTEIYFCHCLLKADITTDDTFIVLSTPCLLVRY